MIPIRPGKILRSPYNELANNYVVDNLLDLTNGREIYDMYVFVFYYTEMICND